MEIVLGVGGLSLGGVSAQPNRILVVMGVLTIVIAGAGLVAASLARRASSRAVSGR